MKTPAPSASTHAPRRGGASSPAADCPLGEIFEVWSGYSVREGLDDATGGDYPFIQLSDVNESRTGIRMDKLTRIRVKRNDRLKTLQDGDVLFSGRGVTPFACVVHEPLPSTLASAAFFVLRVQTDRVRVLPEYTAWFLNHPTTRDFLREQVGAGVRISVIRRGVLEDLRLPLPSEEVQEKIVALARLQQREAEQMDRLRELRERLVALETMRLARQPKEGRHEH